jgi:hypothetical protein
MKKPRPEKTSKAAKLATKLEGPITVAGGQLSRDGRSNAGRGRHQSVAPTSKSHRRQPPAIGRRSSADAPTQALRQAWTSRQNRYGIGAFLAVGERLGDDGQLTIAQLTKIHSRPGERPKTEFLAQADPVRLARLLGGLGHPDRVRLANAILIGARTHRELSGATGLKTGPLYHHVRELERAGLLRSASRNLHELTELGRFVLLVATVLDSAGAAGAPAWRILSLSPGRRQAATRGHKRGIR